MSTATKAKPQKATQKPECNCLELAQKAAAEKGFSFSTTMHLRMSEGRAVVIGPLLQIEKIDAKSRKSLPPAVCSYCPFCGKKKHY